MEREERESVLDITSFDPDIPREHARPEALSIGDSFLSDLGRARMFRCLLSLLVTALSPLSLFLWPGRLPPLKMI